MNLQEIHFRFVILMALHLAFPFVVKAADLSFSARLVNEDGSPVAGPVELSFELAYSNDTSDILCSKDLSDVALSSGVFHANLEFGTDECVNSKELAQVLQETPSGESLMMRVSDETDGTNIKTYPFQALNTVPMSVMSQTSKTLSQMGAESGEVLKWDGDKWGPASDEGKDGTVISITAGDGLDGGTITETGTIKVKSGGIVVGMLAPDSVTSAKIDDKTIQNADIDDGEIKYIKLNLQDNDIQASKVAGLKGAAFVDVGMDSGMAMQPNDVPNCAADEKLQMSALPVYPRSWSCVGESTGMDDTKLPLAGGTMSGAIDMGGNEVTNLLAPNSATDATTKQYVDNELSNKAESTDLDNYVARAGDNMTGALKLDAQNELRLADSDSNEYIGLRSHTNVVGNYVLTFPADTGATDQVLSTDGSGNLSWTTPSTTATPEGSAGGELAGTYPNPTIDDNVIDNANIATGADIDAAKLGTGVVNNTEFNTLDGVTSSIQDQLDDKEGSLPDGGTTGNFLRGDKSWQALTTDNVSEGDNKYFLDSRAQTAVVRQTIATGETGTSPSEDAVNTALAGKADNDDLDNYVLKAGDSMSGDLNMGATHTLTNLAAPSAASDATTKEYVDDGLADKADSTALDDYVAITGDTMTGPLKMGAQNELRLADTGSTNYVGLRSSASVTTYTLTLPDSVGALDQVLSTDGSGNLSWSTPSTTATPEGAAGGELAGTYPNPTIEDGVIDNANIATSAGIDAAKLGTGVVSNAEFNTLDGVTSSIQDQLDAKEGSITEGAATEYWRGDKSWQALNTAAVQETTNLYFTDQRAKDATVDNAIDAAETERAPSQSAVASALGDYVLKDGDTMTGALELPANGLVVGTDQLIATGGNVGIGTASPTQMLDVNGDVTANEFRVKSKAIDIPGAGWYRLAEMTGSAGRGECEFRLYTIGGDVSPKSANIRAFNDYASYAKLWVESTETSYWTDFRVTNDGAKSYVEGYFTLSNSGSFRTKSLGQVGLANCNLFSGSLTPGGDTVHTLAKNGQLSIDDDLVVTNNGSVGVGTTAPTEKLEVDGTVKATSFDLGLVRVTESCTSSGASDPCSVTCPAGKFIISGGCRTGHGDRYIRHNYATSSTQWTCKLNAAATSFNAYAICGNVKGF